MSRCRAGLACIPVLAVAASSLAVVVAAAPPAEPPVAQGARLKVDITGFDGDAAALLRAITAFEKSNGGIVVEARYANRAGVGGYEGAVAHGNQVTFMRVDRPTAGGGALAGDRG